MKNAPILLLASVILLHTPLVHAQTNSVTSGDFVNYTINGQPDPPFTFQRGTTYVFLLSGISIHPFWIKSSLGFGSAGAFNTGVANNGATSGSLTFTVPAGAPNHKAVYELE